MATEGKAAQSEVTDASFCALKSPQLWVGLLDSQQLKSSTGMGSIAGKQSRHHMVFGCSA